MVTSTDCTDNYLLSDKVVISDLIECADRLTLTSVSLVVVASRVLIVYLGYRDKHILILVFKDIT